MYIFLICQKYYLIFHLLEISFDNGQNNNIFRFDFEKWLFDLIIPNQVFEIHGFWKLENIEGFFGSTFKIMFA